MSDEVKRISLVDAVHGVYYVSGVTEGGKPVWTVVWHGLDAEKRALAYAEQEKAKL